MSNASNTSAADTSLEAANAAASRQSASSASSNFGVRSEGRKNNFDFLRFFLATAVIYHHSFDLLLGYMSKKNGFETTRPDTLGQLTGQLDFGSLSVNYFFVISGFLITMSWLHSKGFLDYCKKRLLRIYPGYAAALLFSTFLIGPLSVASVRTYFHSRETYLYLSALFFRERYSLPGIFPNVPVPIVNGSLWTIRYELLCYLLVALLGITALLRARLAVGLIFAAWYGIYIAALHGIVLPHIGDPDKMLRLGTYFLAGTVFYLYRDRIPYSTNLFAISIAGIVGSLLLHVSTSTFPIFGTYFLFYLAFNPALKMEHFARHGDFSYGTYVYAFPVQQLLIQHYGRFLNPYLLFFLSWIIVVPIAAASWHLLEKPFLKLKGKTKAIPEESNQNVVKA